MVFPTALRVLIIRTNKMHNIQEYTTMHGSVNVKFVLRVFA